MRENSCSTETEVIKEPETDKREWTTPHIEAVDIAEVTEAGLVSSLLNKLGFSS